MSKLFKIGNEWVVVDTSAGSCAALSEDEAEEFAARIIGTPQGTLKRGSTGLEVETAEGVKVHLAFSDEVPELVAFLQEEFAEEFRLHSLTTTARAAAEKPVPYNYYGDLDGDVWRHRPGSDETGFWDSECNVWADNAIDFENAKTIWHLEPLDRSALTKKQRGA